VRPANSQVDDLLSEINLRVEVNERVLVTTLTKRMSEDLTEYLSEHGQRVRYLHSDIDTVERVEIIRDLRKGEFDVLVGINLLREGLDMPEVSLVAILDADKEGFLRSGTTLVQTVGRAARNLNGKAILYGDKITNSMRFAIDETERRRKKQKEYNNQNNIVPKGIKKNITDILEGAHANKRGSKNKFKNNEYKNLETLPPEIMMKKIKVLEKKMYQHARDLEFEEAANLRDEIESMQKNYLGFEDTDTA